MTNKKIDTKETKYRIVGFYRETEFQETPIGKIPKDWRITVLKNVANINTNVNVKITGKKVARIPMELIPETKIYAKYELTDVNNVKSYIIAKAGDILLAKITPSFENGKQGIVPDDVPNGVAFVTTEVYPITSLNINKFFLFYLLKLKKYRKILEYKMTGTTGRRRVPRDVLENLTIPLPPLEEQWGIAEVLFSIDQAIEAVDRLIQKLEHVKRVLMQELLTKGIGHREFQDMPIGKIPKGWKIVKLGDVARVDARAVMPTPGVKYYYLSLEDIESDTGRILKSPEVLTDGVEIKSTKYVFTANHVLYGRLRPYLNKVALPSRDGICSTDILPLLPNTRLVLREYLAYVLLHQRFVEYATARMKGTNHPRVKSQDVLDYRFPLPPIEEQQKIVQILSTISNWVEVEKIRKNKLENIKNNLMELLLTGTVRVVVEKEYESAG